MESGLGGEGFEGVGDGEGVHQIGFVREEDGGDGVGGDVCAFRVGRDGAEDKESVGEGKGRLRGNYNSSLNLEAMSGYSTHSVL